MRPHRRLADLRYVLCRQMHAKRRLSAGLRSGLATDMAKVAPNASSFSGQAPAHGKAPHSHAQGLALKIRRTAKRPPNTSYDQDLPAPLIGAGDCAQLG
jgi:hypothetical protein